MASGLLAILQTRLELAAVELEEESLRLFTYLLLALAALFCVFVALLLGILLIVVLYWDVNRIGVIVSLVALFGVAAVLLAAGICKSYRKKPRLLAYSRDEIAKDIDRLNPLA
jgi:uncharacterized membrane protein YqjE